MYRRSPCARGRVHFDFSEEVVKKLHATNHNHPHRINTENQNVSVVKSTWIRTNKQGYIWCRDLLTTEDHP
ncbi:hypothetical protein CHARACLAT_014069 [Characodon lateralis]|uniref:Uncharacterized protein n=1 Tax=Characodon lateralis TaxID=208331 RepID=A0ABU7E9F8_9TELE|nr:hypothetical protein [Characodon lateralis]